MKQKGDFREHSKWPVLAGQLIFSSVKVEPRTPEDFYNGNFINIIYIFFESYETLFFRGPEEPAKAGHFQWLPNFWFSVVLVVKQFRRYKTLFELFIMFFE